MMRVTKAERDLARQVLSLEAKQNPLPGDPADADERVYARLQMHLVRVVGVEGFVALLSRALALVKADVPWLGSVEVPRTGALNGLHEAASVQDADAAAAGHLALLAQTIDLLILFIGEALTISLLRQIWREVALNDTPLSHNEETER